MGIGKTYVVRGSNRIGAARRLGFTDSLELREVDLPFLGYKSEEDVVRAWANLKAGNLGDL